MAEYVSMYPCRECGEDVPTSECYDDLGVLMHTMGVTGQAEPHENGSTQDDLKRVDIQEFSRPQPSISDQARALRVGGPRYTNEARIASGTCWNAEQIAEVIEKYDRYGEMVKLEVTHHFRPGKTQYHWMLLMTPPLNEGEEDDA